MASIRHDWYLREWVDALDCSITDLRERTGWTHRIASQLVNRKLRWNRDHLSEAAYALHLEPWELLMDPQDSMEIRSLRKSITLAAERRLEYRAAAPDISDLQSKRTGTEGEK